MRGHPSANSSGPAPAPAPRRPRRAVGRRGGIYVAVLGISTVVAVVGIGAALVLRVQNRAARRFADGEEAAWCARSALEAGRALVAADPNWRSTRGNGVWASGVRVGRATYKLEARDPADGDVTVGPSDPLVLRATAVCGGAKQVLEVTLVSEVVPLPLLKTALHTAGQIHLRAGKTFYAIGSTVSTNGSVRNDGTIQANIECYTMGGNHLTVPAPYTVTIKAPPKAFPLRVNTIDYYASIGTPIVPGSNIDRKLLAPGVNPWGLVKNPDGVYVIRTTGDLTIKDSRIYGTLVVICPGRKVTVDNSVLLHPARPDYPALIVDGNVVFQHDSGTGSALTEADKAVNFNPAGTPYLGMTDADTADSYPSEIRGLVHVTGTVTLSGSARLRGTVICESAATADAFDIGGSNEIVYDPALYTNPPRGYEQRVVMRVQRGGYRRIVQ